MDISWFGESLFFRKPSEVTLDIVILPSTTIITFFRVWYNFLVDSLAPTCFGIGARRCLHQLVATSIFVHNLDTHLERDTANTIDGFGQSDKARSNDLV